MFMGEEEDSEELVIKEVDYSLNDILDLANETEGTSDIHFKVGIPPYLRVDGELHSLDSSSLNKDDTFKFATSILSPDQQSVLSETGDVDSSFRIEQRNDRYRVHVCKDDNGYSIDLRLIPDDIISVEKIGFPYDAVWHNIVHQKEGLVLITGKTGQGKTTTMASLIQKINDTRAENIITIEDPIEYVFHHNNSIITQREVGNHVVSFEKGLEGALRQDPDVILIGEIRNKDTAYIALEAAGSGHLVFSTLHTINAIETVRQYANFFGNNDKDRVRSLLASTLNYVLSQQLVPDRKDGGRALAMEIMNVRDSDSIKSLLRDGKEHQLMTSLQTGQNWGMITMDDSLKELYSAGRISHDDLLLYSHNPKDI
jgi:twitching motility protein PilT